MTKMNNHHSSYITHKNTTAYDDLNPGLGMGQTQTSVGVKQANGILNSSFDNWISNGNTYINK